MLNIETTYCQLENEEIMVVSWLDYDPFMKLNFEKYFFNIIEQIHKARIRKLVLDCSCRRHDPSEEDFKEIFTLFLSGLSTTELDKMARICPVNSSNILKFNNLLEDLKAELNLRFKLKNFNKIEEGFAWLKAKNYHESSNDQQVTQ